MSGVVGTFVMNTTQWNQRWVDKNEISRRENHIYYKSSLDGVFPVRTEVAYPSSRKPNGINVGRTKTNYLVERITFTTTVHWTEYLHLGRSWRIRHPENPMESTLDGQKGIISSRESHLLQQFIGRSISSSDGGGVSVIQKT